MRIEVKTSSYIQVWAQKALSHPQFTIRETKAWHPETGTYEAGSRRQSDVYVFCLETYQGHGVPDPCDLDQWAFYVVATSVLDARGHQQTLSLSQLEGELGARPHCLADLPAAILWALED